MSPLSRRKFVTGVAGALAVAAATSQLAQAAPNPDLGAAATDPYTQTVPRPSTTRSRTRPTATSRPQGIPYHSVETLMVEAPDHGHETTSEAFSYWIWLEATYGRVTGDWTPFNDAWAIDGEVHHPDARRPADQRLVQRRARPATYAPEWPDPSSYPQPARHLGPGRPGPDRRRAQDGVRHRRHLRHALADGRRQRLRLRQHARHRRRERPDRDRPVATSTPTSAARRSRCGRPSRSRPATTCSSTAAPTATWTCSSRTSSYAKQWKYTDAPDADARADPGGVLGATRWATARARQSQVAAIGRQGRQDGRLPALLDVRQVLQEDRQLHQPDRLRGRHRQAAPQHYLLAWYYAWGGAEPGGGWAWRIGDGATHHGYQNPLAAWALSTVTALDARSRRPRKSRLDQEPRRGSWSSTGGCSRPRARIAGGAHQQLGRRSTARRRPATPTFYGMAYDWEPVYHDPPSNNWFGMQAWAHGAGRGVLLRDRRRQGQGRPGQVGRLGDAAAPPSAPAAPFQIPSTLDWTGQPDTWNAGQPGHQRRPARDGRGLQQRRRRRARPTPRR